MDFTQTTDMSSGDRIKYLLDRYANDMATEPEIIELLEWIRKTGGDDEMKAQALRVWRDKHPANEASELEWKTFYRQTILPAERKKRSARLIRIGSAVAASLLLVIGGYYTFKNPHSETPQTVGVRDTEKIPVTDLAPGRDGAILTLADGSNIVLDTAASGKISEFAVKTGNEISYAEAMAGAVPEYNKMTTPRGRQFSLVLADGTKVWLNAESSIRFPTVFTGDKRMVEITGEAYFDVVRQDDKPFIVSAANMQVEVMGTQFNINSYSNEPFIKTTLLEGRVKVSLREAHMPDGEAQDASSKQVFLNPGQQAIIVPGQENIRVAYDVNLEEVVAWKKGRFLFNGASIESIMRQVERWYDVSVVYEKKTSETISGGLPRSENVSQLLNILEATDKIDFEIKERQIIVKPK